ncbi:MAG TPA: competence/damage-inducible protein A [Actinomycetota bacterium]|nr:competence/damage-inducible protein A [Actinomycetota bacterium]
MGGESGAVPAAEVLAVGSELLAGQIVNSNAAEVSAALAEAGLEVRWHTVVGDEVGEIASAVARAVGRAAVTVVCGGLGPTHDDLTREGIAQALGRPLAQDPALVGALEQRFATMGRAMSVANLRQADLPQGASSIPNPNGTAPGVFVEHDGHQLYALPGVPGELRAMLSSFVLPSVVAGLGAPAVVTATVRTAGIAESDLAARVAPVLERAAAEGAGRVKVAILASSGEVRLCLTAPADEASAALVASLESSVRALLGPLVYGGAGSSLESTVSQMLRERGMTLAVAESLTGGLLASRIVSLPGASDVLVAGYVAYSVAAKERDLGVPAAVIEEHGVVSVQTARAMAVGARARAGASVALSTTGEAGPLPAQGGSKPAPVGSVCVGLAWEEGAGAWAVRMGGSREMIRARTCTWALNQLRLWLLGEGPPPFG